MLLGRTSWCKSKKTRMLFLMNIDRLMAEKWSKTRVRNHRSTAGDTAPSGQFETLLP